MDCIDRIYEYIENKEPYFVRGLDATEDDIFYEPEYWTLDCDRVLLVSDSHFGSKLETRNIDTVFNFAIKNNIRCILHGGDFIQGGIGGKDFNKDMNIVSQLCKAMNEYPLVSGIDTTLLFGNHDFYAFKYNRDLMNIYNSRSDIHTIGIKKSIIDMNPRKENSTRISLEHKIGFVDIRDVNYNEVIRFHGHEHQYRKDKNDIWIPSLCNTIDFPGISESAKYLDCVFEIDSVIVRFMQGEKISEELVYRK